MYYLPRTEHNPLYQSAEDLTDRGVPTWKQLQDYQEDNDGYEILRARPTSMGNGNKVLPVSKKENGFLYCLSPPAPLRPVPSPRRALLQNQSPRPRRETPTTKEREVGRGGHRMRPSNLTPDLASAMQTQQKDSPIYEMPDKFINTGRRRHHLEPPGHTPPPALPGRRNGGSVGGTASSEPQLPHLPPAQIELALPCSVLAGNIDQKAPEGILLYGNQRCEESGDEMELQEVLQAGKADEVHREKTLTPDDVSALYANVKKIPKDGIASATGPKMRREESIDGERPPDVPPYRGGGEDWLDEEPPTTTTTEDDVEEKTQYALPLPPSLTDTN